MSPVTCDHETGDLSLSLIHSTARRSGTTWQDTAVEDVVDDEEKLAVVVVVEGGRRDGDVAVAHCTDHTHHLTLVELEHHETVSTCR